MRDEFGCTVIIRRWSYGRRWGLGGNDAVSIVFGDSQNAGSEIRSSTLRTKTAPLGIGSCSNINVYVEEWVCVLVEEEEEEGSSNSICCVT